MMDSLSLYLKEIKPVLSEEEFDVFLKKVRKMIGKRLIR